MKKGGERVAGGSSRDAVEPPEKKTFEMKVVSNRRPVAGNSSKTDDDLGKSKAKGGNS